MFHALPRPSTSRLRSEREGLARGMVSGAGPVKMILSAFAATCGMMSDERARLSPVW
jgi:hypothetical protein